MKNERSLVEDVKHLEGRYGGFSFGGVEPEGIVVRDPLPSGTVFPNGATTALLMTFDVEGSYGNGGVDMEREIDNYARICERLRQRRVKATFNVVGKMAEEHGPAFVEWMWDAGCEVAPHGYVHDLNKRYGGDRVYAGHYGSEENLAQVREGIAAIDAIRPGQVKGFRLPYGHFNEYSYDAFDACGLTWSSNIGMDDFIVPGQGVGPSPFRMQLGEKRYKIVEIPLDSQTYDWSVWIADEQANGLFVEAVRRYCALKDIKLERAPRGAVEVWRHRIQDAIDAQTCLTLLCHPINLTVLRPEWGDPVDEFMLPVIEHLATLQQRGKVWVCTCGELAEFYNTTMTDNTSGEEANHDH